MDEAEEVLEDLAKARREQPAWEVVAELEEVLSPTEARFARMPEELV